MKLGFVGLGNMGRSIAGNMLAAGQQVTRVEVDRAGKIIVILKTVNESLGSPEPRPDHPSQIVL